MIVHWLPIHLGQLAPTTLPQRRLVSNARSAPQVGGGGGMLRTHKSIYVICVADALPPTLVQSRLLEELTGRSWLLSCSL